MNYLSLWIGNFGVVPWFSLAFFLFLPALFCLSFLLVRVFIVLDPMILSSIYLKLLKYREKYLTFTLQLVKIFIILIYYIYCSSSFSSNFTIIINIYIFFFKQCYFWCNITTPKLAKTLNWFFHYEKIWNNNILRSIWIFVSIQQP